MRTRAPAEIAGPAGARARRPAALACLWLATACATPPPVAPPIDRVGAAAASARARVAWIEGARERAVEWYERAVALDPESALLHAQLGHALMVTDELEAARVELAQARQLDPDRCAGAVDLAELDLRERHSEQATETLLAVVTREPGDERALQLLHPLLLHLGRSAEGLAVYSRALERRPDLAFVHEAQADFLARVGRTEEALAGYRRALALDPRRTVAERKAVHLLELESERLLRRALAPAAPRVELPAAKGVAVGSR